MFGQQTLHAGQWAFVNPEQLHAEGGPFADSKCRSGWGGSPGRAGAGRVSLHEEKMTYFVK
jgi:hypothetical protein